MKIFTRFMALLALAGTTTVTTAIAAPNSPELVIDVATGQVLHQDEATRPWYPASTTKMMTAYVALRMLQSGEVKLDTPLIASARASAQPPSKIGIRPGQEITLENALKILMVKSANDLAIVIAEALGGSVDGFSAKMNSEAARLGMRESHFVNPHGLFSANHVSSARDLAILGRAMLVEFPEYHDLWGIGAVQLGNRVYKNTNGLIGRYPGAEGMKTGFVCPSGFNVVALANRGGRQLLAVVLGAGSGAERTVRTAQILDKGFGGNSWGGGSSLTALSGSGYNSAPNMRQEICRKGRQIPLTEEDDASISVNAAYNSNSDHPIFGMMAVQPTSGAARSVGGTGQNGRAVLGPRADLPITPVRLGRTPGSTEVARGPGRPMVKTAAAFASAPTSATTIMAAPLQPRRPHPLPEDENDNTSTQPLKLPSAITQSSLSLRSAVPAPKTGNAILPPSKVQAGRAVATRTAPKSSTADKTPTKTKSAPQRATAKIGDKAKALPGKKLTPKIQSKGKQ